jgi:enoyl-CoA hydratase/carnithine racemase
MMNFETLSVGLADGIATVELNRPDVANAMSLQMCLDISEAFRWVDETPEARVSIISGCGKHFTSGIDLAVLAGLSNAIQHAYVRHAYVRHAYVRPVCAGRYLRAGPNGIRWRGPHLHIERNGSSSLSGFPRPGPTC